MSFTHPAAPRVIKSGLFEGIDHFRDLEDRISSLSGEGAENEKGAVFEVFAEAALTSLSEIQAKHVWGPVVSLAAPWLRHLRRLRGLADDGYGFLIATGSEDAVLTSFCHTSRLCGLRRGSADLTSLWRAAISL